MLQIKNVIKEYNTEGFKQKALDNVSINFRKAEFASILGPSGSGKTTFLNIVGGLDKYDSGDLIINNISTKKYMDKDWDAYRNHRVGFVFQSYNLISHQTVLQNVELALTLSGVSKSERRKKAKMVLKKVGLIDHINKKPNQLSGGQMQRVAIARALVNDPEILLADEPTGALDSNTSIQIMELLKDISRDKLVIMVTHNPELAMEYSTRIIKLKDGKVIDDSNPYDDEDMEKNGNKSNKTSMRLLTALGLSLNNLMTKKGRTILTAFAGSIGIIGIALIMALSNGVQEYISRTERETLASYPLQIEATAFDLSGMIESVRNTKDASDIMCSKDKICTIDDISTSRELKANMSIIKNNLIDFKKYLDSNERIKNYVTDIQYVYDFDLEIYNGDIKVNPNTFSLTDNLTNNSFSYQNNNVFTELINNDTLLSAKYTVLKGRLPKNYDELVLVVDKDNHIPLSIMYALNIENRDMISGMVDRIKKGEDIQFDSIEYDYDTLMSHKFKLVLNTSYYEKQNGLWVDKSSDYNYMNNIINQSMDLKIVGIVKINDEATATQSGFIGYTHGLTEYVITQNNNHEMVKEQINNKDINVLTGKAFDGFKNTFAGNLKTFGAMSLDNPTTINIYPKDFDSKKEIENIIDEYNVEQTDENVITYTDMIGVLLSSVTSIVNIISYVLIAFVAVSLIVSSIMIAIITYISVLERTKEIGILRAIGASKKDITRVFNAETIIEGLAAGLMGVGVAYLFTIPANAVIKSALNVSNLMHLKLISASLLVLISVVLTVIAGFVPSKMASKKNPVESLRSE